jgi:hypothetical protein
LSKDFTPNSFSSAAVPSSKDFFGYLDRNSLGALGQSSHRFQRHFHVLFPDLLQVFEVLDHR